MLRLYTFQISHFAEKARWALDWKGVKYQERRLLPGPHLAVTRRLGTVTSVPILVCDGQVVQGSSAIIDFADERWPFDNFWQAIASPNDRARWQNSNAARNAIRRAVRVERSGSGER